MMIIEIREAFWTAPALWRFAVNERFAGDRRYNSHPANYSEITNWNLLHKLVVKSRLFT
jgi:hypothetical protein